MEELLIIEDGQGQSDDQEGEGYHIQNMAGEQATLDPVEENVGVPQMQVKAPLIEEEAAHDEEMQPFVAEQHVVQKQHRVPMCQMVDQRG